MYRDAAVEQSARLVSLLDRNPHSRTRGSFSRTHWAWKFTDFPYPRFQEGVYALARLHDLDAPGNQLFHAPAVESWVAWALEYWVSLQHANGAYDEAYPFEQCLAATAFTGFYVGSTLAHWGERLEPRLRGRVEAALVRAGDWLCHHDETHGMLSNHLAAAAASLELAARTLDAPRFSVRARVFLDRILAHQSSEGWMVEYGGADIGYGTHAFFYLAAYWKLTGCERTRAALAGFADFLAHFVHPDGTIGGEYGSRNTEFYYPAGFEMLAAVSPASASIASALRRSMCDRRVCGVWSMDEFNLMPMLNNVLVAHDAAESLADTQLLPYERDPFRRYFPEAGLWVVNEPAYYAVVGVSKGGTVSVFDKASRRLTARHSALMFERGAERFISQDFQRSPEAIYAPAGATLQTTVVWKSLETKVFGSPLFMLFRLVTLTVGRLPMVSRWLKVTLVRVLIQRKRRPAVVHQRTLRVEADGIHVHDEIETPWDSGELSAVEQCTALHMGSALYADARSAGPGPLLVSWPAARRMALRGKLTTAGAEWRMDPR
ncbi:MAG: hypothetical protein JWL71_4116 [Acidobacteria bacterium]|nr:hypothetical protein [Acidobacteriota bacterium]